MACMHRRKIKQKQYYFVLEIRVLSKTRNKLKKNNFLVSLTFFKKVFKKIMKSILEFFSLQSEAIKKNYFCLKIKIKKN
jgi:hypothetical protein